MCTINNKSKEVDFPQVLDVAWSLLKFIIAGMKGSKIKIDKTIRFY